MQPTQLFEAVLGLSAPWQVVSAEFHPATTTAPGRLDLRIDFARGGQLPCPTCGVACPAYDTAEHRWRHLHFFQHETHRTARVPRVQCGEHGVGTVQVPWARPGSGFTRFFRSVRSLRAAARGRNADGRSAHGSPGATGRRE